MLLFFGGLVVKQLGREQTILIIVLPPAAANTILGPL